MNLFSSAPLFKHRIAVDVFYEKPALFSGSAFRGLLEVRGTADGGVPIVLEFLSFQLVGAITALRAAAVGALEAEANEIDDHISENRAHHQRFASLLVEDASKIHSLGDLQKPGDKSEGEHDVSSTPDLPDICYDPPTDSSTVIFMKSFPIVICRNTVFKATPRICKIFTFLHF